MKRSVQKFKIADLNEEWTSDRKSVVVDETPALLFYVDGHYYCIEDVCSHDGQPLTDGPREGNVIACPRHGACFDITNGKAMCMPATEGITSFSVFIESDGIYAEA